MTNKMWRKRIAILLAGSMLMLQFPAAAEDMSGAAVQDVKTGVSSEDEKPEGSDAKNPSAFGGSSASESAGTSEASAQQDAAADTQASAESMAGRNAPDEGNAGDSDVVETDAGSSAGEAPAGTNTTPVAADQASAGENTPENISENTPENTSESNYVPASENDSFQGNGEGSGASLESAADQTSFAGSSENETPSETSMDNETSSEFFEDNQTPSEAAMDNQIPSESSADNQTLPESAIGNQTSPEPAIDNQIPAESSMDNQEFSGAENHEAEPAQSETIPEKEAPEEFSDAVVAPSNEKGGKSAKDLDQLSMRYMNLPVDEQKGSDAPDGNEISHVMPGEVTREYFAPAKDGSITTAMASVSWKGDDNTLYDIRPGSLTVRLQKSTDGGETYDEGTSYELNEENEWKVLLEDLPMVEDGKEITYRWVWNIDEAPDGSPLDVENSNEYNLPGYLRTQDEDSEDGLESRREYTYETHLEKYVLSMNWDDMGDLNATLPKKIEITLPDGSTVELSEENNWMVEVSLPVTNRDLSWKLSAADGWVSAGSMAEYDEEDNSTVITFNRRWATEDTIQTTEEEVPVGYSTLTVQYWIGSTEAAPSFVGVYENGQKYNVSVPKVTGYSAQVTRVKGKIDEDTIVNVRYVANTYQVTVYYRYLNGEIAAPASTQEVKTGASYSIASPQLDGYTANIEAVSGTVTGRDLTYIVYYTGVEPENNNGEGRENEQAITVPGTTPAQPEEEFETIDDYKTALGLGEVGINAGECFE